MSICLYVRCSVDLFVYLSICPLFCLSVFNLSLGPMDSLSLLCYEARDETANYSENPFSPSTPGISRPLQPDIKLTGYPVRQDDFKNLVGHRMPGLISRKLPDIWPDTKCTA